LVARRGLLNCRTGARASTLQLSAPALHWSQPHSSSDDRLEQVSHSAD
jgi:hypothetical protein